MNRLFISSSFSSSSSTGWLGFEEEDEGHEDEAFMVPMHPQKRKGAPHELKFSKLNDE